jgi:hypothetical protein
MDQHELQQKIIHEIEGKKLIPKSQWKFTWKYNAMRVFVVGVLILGGITVATTIFILTDHDWDTFSYLDRSFAKDILLSIPYIWVASFIILSSVAYLSFRKTRYGYRYSTTKIVIFCLAVSLISGSLLIVLGYDHYIHDTLLTNVPLYGRLTETKEDVWIYPNKGLLGGTIYEIHGPELFSIDDRNGNTWSVRVATDTELERGATIATGTQIRLIGNMIGNDSFEARIVRPW